MLRVVQDFFVSAILSDGGPTLRANDASRSPVMDSLDYRLSFPISRV